VKRADALCILYQYELQNNGNVYRLLKTLSEQGIPADIYYVSENGKPAALHFKNICPVPVSLKKNAFGRCQKHFAFIHYYQDLANAVVQSGKRYSCIMSVDLPTLGAGCVLKEKFNARLFYYSLEIYTETVNQFYPVNAAFPKNLMFDLIIWWQRKYGILFESKYLKKIDYFFTVNQSLADYFKNKYQYPRDIHIIMNCPEMKWEKPVPLDYRAIFGWKPDDKIFIYQGLLNPGRALKQMIDAMTLAPENIKMVIVGHGVLENELKKQVQNKKLDHRVKFMGAVSYDKLPSYTAGADFGIVYGEMLNMSKFMGSPNKLFEYMHEELPVLLWDTPESRKVLAKYEVGVFSQNDAASIAKGMIALTSSEKIGMFKENCRAGKTEYNWQNQVAFLIKLLSDCLIP
jgi:glycosyltransferase involved in cell wall biosynthesis